MPNRSVPAKDDPRVQAVDRMRARAWSAPEDYAFDRDEANARRPPSSDTRVNGLTVVNPFA